MGPARPVVKQFLSAFKNRGRRATGRYTWPMAAQIEELLDRGFCVLRGHFPPLRIAACREAFWPVLTAYLEEHRHAPNRGPQRHFLPMPFDPLCYAPEFFFDPKILRIVRGVIGERIFADQWGCDVPLPDSQYQEPHVDFARPLFEEAPDLQLPPYMLLVSFGLAPVGAEDGPIEIAAGTHRMPRPEALEAVRSGKIAMEAATLEAGDVLIRHPWALHRGTPNRSCTPRALATIRYVRRWYWDASREVCGIGRATWQSMTPEQQALMRFPVEA